MKTLVRVLMAGGLSATGVFAGAAGASSNVAKNDNTVATSQLPFRPSPKRPAGARPTAVAAPKVNVGSPQLPFRLYQKRPTGTATAKPAASEAPKQ